MQRRELIALILTALAGTGAALYLVNRRRSGSSSTSTSTNTPSSSTSTNVTEKPKSTAAATTTNMATQQPTASRPLTKLRVTIIGQQAFGADVYKRLLQCTEFCDIVAVSAPQPKQSGGAIDPLWKAANDALMANPVAAPCIDTKNLSKNADIQRQWKSFNADLCVLAFVTDILPDEVLNYPRFGSIQYHPSLLPKHRGISSINWAVINGDKETGISIFWVDKYIDHGPILIQEKVAIAPNDSVKTLYFEKLYPLGVDAIARAVRMVADGSAPKVEQDHRLATYEPPCKQPLTQIRWYHNGQQVYDLIRGCDPSPGAWTMYEGQKVSIFDCDFQPEKHEVGWCGKVLNVSQDSFAVRLNGGVLIVKRVMADGGKKISAGEWARGVQLKEGYRFSLE